MSTEPERDIEKSLKAYAEKRREEAGPPLELHPATRQLLQGEVTRLRQETDYEDAPGMWLARLLRPGVLATAAFSLVALICGIILLMPEPPGQQPPLELAKNLDVPESAPVPMPPGSPAAAPSTFDDRKTESDQNKKADLGAAENSPKFKDAAEPMSGSLSPSVAGYGETPPPAATPPAQDRISTGSLSAAAELPAQREGGERTGGAGGGRGGGETSQTFAVSAAPLNSQMAATRAPSGTASDDLNEKRRALALRTVQPLRSSTIPSMVTGYASQQFRRTGTADAKDESNAKVLLSFQVEQENDQLRITDQDGSAFTGFVQKTEDPASLDSGTNQGQFLFAGAAKQKTPLMIGDASIPVTQDKKPKSSDAQTFFFRVTGVSRQSGQQVLFSGTFSAPAAENHATTTAGGVWDGSGTATTLPLSQSELKG